MLGGILSVEHMLEDYYRYKPKRIIIGKNIRGLLSVKHMLEDYYR